METNKLATSGGIYALENSKTGKRYIGKASNFRTRFSAHKGKLEKGTHPNTDLQKDWNDTPFSFIILHYIEDAHERSLKECEEISKNINGYNIVINTPSEKKEPYGKGVMENMRQLREKGFICS